MLGSARIVPHHPQRISRAKISSVQWIFPLHDACRAIPTTLSGQKVAAGMCLGRAVGLKGSRFPHPNAVSHISCPIMVSRAGSVFGVSRCHIHLTTSLVHEWQKVTSSHLPCCLHYWVPLKGFHRNNKKRAVLAGLQQCSSLMTECVLGLNTYILDEFPHSCWAMTCSK